MTDEADAVMLPDSDADAIELRLVNKWMWEEERDGAAVCVCVCVCVDLVDWESGQGIWKQADMDQFLCPHCEVYNIVFVTGLQESSLLILL